MPDSGAVPFTTTGGVDASSRSEMSAERRTPTSFWSAVASRRDESMCRSVAATIRSSLAPLRMKEKSATIAANRDRLMQIVTTK